MQETLLGGLSPQDFLRGHWQKRPLLVRGALPGFRGAIGQNALFRLAARADVESRLVQRKGSRWRVTQGPFPISGYPRGRDWTLLVNGVNHFAEKAEQLLRRFAFIPQSRLDDVMVSYAAPGGGVGPHFDSYDVFLVQGIGRRIWRLARKKAFECEPQSPLRLIRDFVADEEYLLEPGDLLYLPPGWGHDGRALDACLTASVGFRAPAGAELATAFLDYLHERGFRDARYRDPGLRAARRPAMIGAELLRFAEKQVKQVKWNRTDVTEFVGRYLSSPKPNVVFKGSAVKVLSLPRYEIHLDPKTQLLYLGPRFFINGEAFTPPAKQRAVLAALADRRRLEGRRLARAGLTGLILDWQKSGYLRLER
jgi:50S ribosomal protein L16 3-hydroxylase